MTTLNLNEDVMARIGSFISSPRDAVALTHVNREIRENSDQLLKNQYRKTFGEMSQTQQPDKKIIARLLCCAEKQPDAAVDHNIYKAPGSKAPGSRLERWKWIVGVENSLDREVQENYNRNISLLEKTQATSVIQLKNQMKGFWHTDRQIKDYAQFKSDEIKSDEKARETSGLISKVCFACLGFFLKLYFNPSVLNIGKKLETRSRETFAKIGGFNLNDKDYDVVAFHILADEKSVSKYGTYHDDTHLKFSSKSYGKTWVGIFERQQPHSLESLGHYSPNRNFQVLLGREETNDRHRLRYGEPFAGFSLLTQFYLNNHLRYRKLAILCYFPIKINN